MKINQEAIVSHDPHQRPSDYQSAETAQFDAWMRDAEPQMPQHAKIVSRHVSADFITGVLTMTCEWINPDVTPPALFRTEYRKEAPFIARVSTTQID